jgi:hypothetical protein
MLMASVTVNGGWRYPSGMNLPNLMKNTISGEICFTYVIASPTPPLVVHTFHVQER